MPVGSTNIGRLIVNLVARTKKFRSGMTRAEATLNRFSRSAGSLGLKLGALSVGPLALASREAIHFETSMAKVATMLDEASMKYLPALRNAVERVAVQFGRSAKSTADALYDVLSAQMGVSNAMGILRQGAKSAAGGFTDMATSTSALITLMRAYGDELQGAGDAADFLFSVVKRGRLTYEEMATNLGKVVPVAAASNVELAEFGAALAMISRGMPDTARATTALANVIETFLKNTAEAQKAAAELGIRMSSAGLRSQGLLYVLKKLAQVDPDVVARVFPRQRALRGLVTSLNEIKNVGQDYRAMLQRAGAAQRAFSKVAGTAGFELRRMWEALKNAARIFARRLLPAITDTAQAIRRWLTTNQGTVNMLGKIAVGVAGVSGALLALATVTKVFSFIVGGIRSVIAAVKALGKALAWLWANPLALTIALGVALGVVLTKLGDKLGIWHSILEDLEARKGLGKALGILNLDKLTAAVQRNADAAQRWRRQAAGAAHAAQQWAGQQRSLTQTMRETTDRGGMTERQWAQWRSDPAEAMQRVRGRMQRIRRQIRFLIRKGRRSNMVVSTWTQPLYKQYEKLRKRAQALRSVWGDLLGWGGGAAGGMMRGGMQRAGAALAGTREAYKAALPGYRGGDLRFQRKTEQHTGRTAHNTDEMNRKFDRLIRTIQPPTPTGLDGGKM